MKKEISELLSNEREYYYLEEEFLCLEADLKREESDLEMVSADFACRHEAELSVIEQLKREIEDQKNILKDKREHTIELKQEHKLQKDQLASRNLEISKYKQEVASQKLTSEQLLNTCNSFKQEITTMTEKLEQGEIEEEMNILDQKEQESLDLNAQAESCEYKISQQLEQIEHLNQIVDAKNKLEIDKEAEYKEAEQDIVKIKDQVQNFSDELINLKQINEKLVGEI